MNDKYLESDKYSLNIGEIEKFLRIINLGHLVSVTDSAHFFKEGNYFKHKTILLHNHHFYAIIGTEVFDSLGDINKSSHDIFNSHNFTQINHYS